MYKVFVDNIPICFQKDDLIESNIASHFFPSVTIDKYNSFLKELNRINVKETVLIRCADPMTKIQTFFQNFKWIEAAGGIVQNTNTNKVLFIFRNETWDIPKGKIEKEESPEQGAIREIEEECGIKNLKITSLLSPTFHIYFAYGRHFIKKTHWFRLTTDETDVQPQGEEGITAAKWFDLYDLELIRENTFNSIKEVIEDYLKKLAEG